MATREENIQKINNQLEQLSDEELEQVAGGSQDELAQLVRAMRDNKKVGFDEGEYLFGSLERWEYLANQRLDKLGINADIHWSIFSTTDCPNSYTDKANGKTLTHQEVLDRIKNYKG